MIFRTYLSLALASLTVSLAMAQSSDSPKIRDTETPFTLKYRISLSDPRSDKVFEKEEAQVAQLINSKVKSGAMNQQVATQYLRGRREAREQKKPGVKSILTLSSQGKDLLALVESDDKDNPKLLAVVLNTRGHSYVLYSGAGKTVSGITVRSEPSPGFGPSLPFLGVHLPTLPPFLKLEGNGKAEGDAIEQPAQILVSRAQVDEKTPLMYVPGTVTMHGPTGAEQITGVLVGKAEAPSSTWDLSGYQDNGGIAVPGLVKCDQYEAFEGIKNPPASMETKYELLSATTSAQAKEMFEPEHYAKQGDMVQYKITGKSTRSNDFVYRDEGKTIDQQAAEHDKLEAGLQVREKRETAPAGSMGGIFAIVFLVAGLAVFIKYRTSRARAA